MILKDFVQHTAPAFNSPQSLLALAGFRGGERTAVDRMVNLICWIGDALDGAGVRLPKQRETDHRTGDAAMTNPLVNIQALIDDAKCFDTVRRLRWPEGVHCPSCASAAVARHGHDDRQPHRQRDRCTACHHRFDDLTGTIFAGPHQPLRVWVLCLYFMGLNLSNRQISEELGVNQGDVQAMTEPLRAGVRAARPPQLLSGVVECDEVYVTAGHKGNPAAVAQKTGSGGATD